MMMQIVGVVSIWFLGLTVLYAVGRRWLLRIQSRNRVFDGIDDDKLPPVPDLQEDATFLTRWLYLAGFRTPAAAVGFMGIEIVSLFVALLTAYVSVSSGLVERSSHVLDAIPGAVSDLFHAFVLASPWLFAITLVAMPALIVRDARKRRVLQVERDIPIVLDMLATLSEAGLGFDAALDRLLDAQPAQNPLTLEFRTFQGEVGAGRPRVQCLRRLARRVEVTSLSIFISALVQAEQVGSGVADVLRSQAEDMRSRRRERALTQATALPVKMLFPLVICFLPGIFALTLGPIFYQFFLMAESYMRTPMGK